MRAGEQQAERCRIVSNLRKRLGIYSLYIVKEFVSDVDIVSRNSFDHYLFAKKIIKFSQYIVLLNYISR